MDENAKQEAVAARKRRLRWSIAICLFGLFLIAINFGVAIWADCLRNAGRPIDKTTSYLVRSADALMPPGIILLAAGFAGMAVNAAREK